MKHIHGIQRVINLVSPPSVCLADQIKGWSLPQRAPSAAGPGKSVILHSLGHIAPCVPSCFNNQLMNVSAGSAIFINNNQPTEQKDCQEPDSSTKLVLLNAGIPHSWSNCSVIQKLFILHLKWQCILVHVFFTVAMMYSLLTLLFYAHLPETCSSIFLFSPSLCQSIREAYLCLLSKVSHELVWWLVNV